MGCLLGGPRDEDLAPEELAEHHRVAKALAIMERRILAGADEG